MPAENDFLAKLKKKIAESGQSKKGIWYVKEGQKKRVRFLTQLTKGKEIVWHSKWVGQKSEVDTPCLAQYGKDCPFCGVDGVSERERFAWTVYDYEEKQRQIFLFYANRNSPVMHLAPFYEQWGTITDRDLVIQRTGKGVDTVYTIIPNGPSDFLPKGVKRFTTDELLELVWKAFGQGSLDDYSDEGEEEEEEEEYEDEDIEEGEEGDTDDEDYEDDDEEEEELPRKPVKAKAKVPAKPARKATGRR